MAAYCYTNRTFAIGLTSRGAEERIQAVLDEMSGQGWEYLNGLSYDSHVTLFFRKER